MTGGNRHHDKFKIKYHTDTHFNQETKKQSYVKRPKIQIKLTNLSDYSQQCKFFALVDSGADTSFISKTISDSLNIDLSNSKQVKSSGIGGTINTFRERMGVSIVYREQEISLDPILFAIPESDEDETSNNILLGRDCFFNKYEITFNELKQHIMFKKVN